MEFWEDVEILKSFFKLGPWKSQGFSEAVKKKIRGVSDLWLPLDFFCPKNAGKIPHFLSVGLPCCHSPLSFWKILRHRILWLVSACGVFSNSLRKKWPTVTSIYMGISLKWWYPQIIHFNGVFHWGTTILGNPYIYIYIASCQILKFYQPRFP